MSPATDARCPRGTCKPHPNFPELHDVGSPEDARPDCPTCARRMLDRGASLYCAGDSADAHAVVELFVCGACGAACWPDEVNDDAGQLCEGCYQDGAAFAAEFGIEDDGYQDACDGE